jgi:FemAB-related protein (PEP-CTERM system-associated)
MIQVIPYSDECRAAWDSFVTTHPAATVAHQIGWRSVIHNALGHAPRYLLAVDGSQVRGVLPLFLVRTWWQAKYLISIPWLDYGGVCAADTVSGEALLLEGSRLAKELGCQFMELRSVTATSEILPVSADRVTFELKLTGDPDELLRSFDAKLRNQIRKSQKSELNIEIGGEELLRGFYSVFCRNMRDLGTPVWGRELFTQVITHFPDSARIIVIRKGREVIAGGLVLSFRGRMYVPSASANRKFLSYCPNHALYWRLLEDGCLSGLSWFDFGRSAIDSSTYKFKKQWVPEPTQLHWQYCLNGPESIPAINPRNPKYRFFINSWRRLPLPLANILGPRVIRNFP